jgi:type IV pilus secretin PilQ/predicted competence protein
MRKIIFIAILSIIIGAGPCIPSQGQISRTTDVKSSGTIEYLEFREVDIKDVLRQLAKQYNLNIVFSESVKGLITVQLHDVTVEEALDSIITINGFVYTKKGRVIKVTTPQEAEREGKQTKVFRLNNADATKMKETLKKVLSPEGTIEADVRSNSLIITDNPGVITKIEEMLPGLDETTLQVLIEARFIETTLGRTQNLGIKWTMSATATGAIRPITFPFEPEKTEGWIKEISPTVDPSDTGAGQSFPSLYGFPYASTTDFTFGTLDFSQLQSVLEFLKTNTDSKLISSPRIVTMDNKQAEIYVGKARPIPQFEFNSDTGEYQITGFEEKIEGVTLTVTPTVSRIGKDKYNIKLKLRPKVTTFSENVPFTAPSFNYPVMSERYTDTEVMIEDGQTIVIGGLIETKKTETIRKVPFLGDIPLLGLLFTHKSVDPNTRTELLIFVTARVIRENEGRPLAFQSNLVTTPSRPFKLDLREVVK